MPTYLVKTEPETYSFDDLVRKKTAWTGVSNNAAPAHLRTMHKGDEVFVYHTGDEKAIVGLAAVAGSPYEDPAQAGKTPTGAPQVRRGRSQAREECQDSRHLAAIKADKRFAEFALVKQSRLSVMPVPPALDKRCGSLAGL